ncbi:hypothetical protein [Flexithrix dorotheae]|uniref:hypothetical protein n=1 Tax=Flexithrix dorotheae TaxID=70993 RepID=UPI00035C66CE|nr:hypothetical protein [Flexithrix dorotheae]
MINLFHKPVFIAALIFLGSINAEPVLKKENRLEFQIDETILNGKDIQYYLILVDKEGKVISETKENESEFSFEKQVKPFDIYNYWDKKGDEEYFILMTKVAYVVDKDISFFSEKKLSDVNFLNERLPDYKIEETGDKKYKIHCGFLAPSFEYDLSFYRPPYSQHPEIKSLVQNICIEQINTKLPMPSLTLVQHNYNFSRVLMQKTSKMSVSVSNFYAFEEDKTLEINYTLNYIYELPPKFLGGHDLVINEILDGIKGLIIKTRELSQ